MGKKTGLWFSVFLFVIICCSCEKDDIKNVETTKSVQYEQTIKEFCSEFSYEGLETEGIVAEEIQIEQILDAEKEWLEIHYLDVGQADATLIKCNGHNMLIDGGNVEDSSLIYAYLKEQEIEYLDFIICTHAHEDHVGGLAGALNYSEVGIVYAPVYNYETEAFGDFVKYLDKQNKSIEIPEVNTEFFLGDARCEIIGVNSVVGKVNSTSIVLKMEYGETTFLFSGDNEQDAEKYILDSGVNIKCDVIKIPHHGSDTSLSYRWLNNTEAEYGVISVGKNNSYGHPSENTLSKLRDAEVKTYRTDMQGHIICFSDGKTVTFKVERNADIDTLGCVEENENTLGVQSIYGEEQTKEELVYVLNKNTKKFHYSTCSSVKQMKEKNKLETTLDRDEVIKQGYSSCGNCNP